MNRRGKIETRLFGRLRAKIVILTTGFVAISLLATFSMICYLDYRQSFDDVEKNLSLSIDRAIEDASIGREPIPDSLNDGAIGKIPEIGSSDKKDEDNLTPIAIYRIDGNGVHESMSGQTSAVVSNNNLDSAIHEALISSNRVGMLQSIGLIYCKQERENAVYVAFADESSISSWKKMALTLSIVWLCVMAILFVTVMAFSKAALKPAIEAWNRQSQFMADASHELKTPLTVILADMAILRSHPRNAIDQELQWIDSANDEALRMRDLVDEMLELMQASHAKELEGETFQATDFSDIVEKEVLQFTSVAFERKVSIESTIAEKAIVKGDSQRLSRLCAILLDNACKYSANNGEGEVVLNLSKSAKSAVLSVANNGPAIPADDLPFVFDRFFRSDKSRARGWSEGENGAFESEALVLKKESDGTNASVGGFGLGLAIAKDIADEHGATLSVESSSNSGTIFTLTIPLTAKK